jgi:hypothetical protein
VQVEGFGSDVHLPGCRAGGALRGQPGDTMCLVLRGGFRWTCHGTRVPAPGRAGCLPLEDLQPLRMRAGNHGCDEPARSNCLSFDADTHERPSANGRSPSALASSPQWCRRLASGRNEPLRCCHLRHQGRGQLGGTVHAREPVARPIGMADRCRHRRGAVTLQ